MTSSRSERIYTLFIDYLFTGRMNIDDCIGVMQGFELSQDYEGSNGVYNALYDYVLSLDFNLV
jgi:hypothetical protein